MLTWAHDDCVMEDQQNIPFYKLDVKADPTEALSMQFNSLNPGM